MTVRVALATVVRAVVLLAIDAVFVLFVTIPGDEDGMGTGLVLFGTLMLVTAAWGVVDGCRMPLGRLVLVWPAAALVYAVSSVVLSDLGASLDVLWFDLAVVGPVTFALVLVPALFTGVVVGALRIGSSQR